MNVSSLLKHLQPLRDKNYAVYLETLYSYLPIENIYELKGTIILNTRAHPLSIKQLVKILFQYDDCIPIKVQYKTYILNVVAIEVLYNMYVVIKTYKEVHDNCL